MPINSGPPPESTERVRDWGDRPASRQPLSSRRPGGEESDDLTRTSLAPPVRPRVSHATSDSTRDASSVSLQPPQRPSVGSTNGPRPSIGNNSSTGFSSISTPGASFLDSIPEEESNVSNKAPLRPTPKRPAPSPRQVSSRRAPTTRGLKPGGVSLFQGPQTIRHLSVLPGSIRTIRDGEPLPPATTVSFTPKRLLDIETGRIILVEKEYFLDSGRYLELDESGALVVSKETQVAPLARDEFWDDQSKSLEEKIKQGSVRDFSVNSEVGFMGRAWRDALQRIIVKSYDEVNALQLSRALQLFMPFLTGYEAYVVGQVIEALDNGRKRDIEYTLNVAFRNRNVSRILVQLIGDRYDFLWHWNTQVTWNRLFDGWGQFPVVGITSFPATENFPSTRNHVLASIFRRVREGSWITRVIAGGRQGLVTDDPNNIAQNLAPESNGFERANINQYGPHVGRRKTNEFRFMHRLPTDESIVRTFVAQPMSTMLNNGVVHVLRQLAKHWRNILDQPSGNFAHQRMEQLNPFETLRFHMPIVLVTLSSLRGRNKWDADVLGPMMRKLQELSPSLNADSARCLIRELKEEIVVNVSGGVADVIDPFWSWLDAIKQACDLLEEEAKKKVYNLVNSVHIGIRFGHDLITQVNWEIPTDKQLKKAILNSIRGENTGNVSKKCIQSAMNLITPRDKRTLIELVTNNLVSSKPAQLLLGRAKTLLQRELRREMLNDSIHRLSKGEELSGLPEHDEWYWLEFAGGSSQDGVYLYDAKLTGHDLHRFRHVDTKLEKFVSLADASVKIKSYTPVAEAISRAQRAFMNIELDHGKKFTYDAFMEFTFLRTALRRLVVISQITCEELDNARLNFLAEVQRFNQMQVSIHELEQGKTYYTYDASQKEYSPFVCQKQYTSEDPEWTSLARTKILKVPPQSMIVVGGGPTGLMTTIHCMESVLTSGGVMTLHEARDAFEKGGATFERAQIVRLDARWIAMLRYHLGTGFEDVFIPASGETDSQLGNTLPTQGFVEITIKDLENMLHVEVSKMWSKGLLTVHTDAKTQYDHNSNTLTKLGEHLKVGDIIYRRVDENGRKVNEYHSWKVTKLNFVRSLGVEELSSLDVESIKKMSKGGHVNENLAMKAIKDKTFTLDVGHTHVVEAIGKQHKSKVHFSVTTDEPYGVCCIQGLKISMGMHNFGEKRWGSGLMDDLRSLMDQNTRIIGDFTKMVRAAPVTMKMLDYMTDEDDTNWQKHFEALVAASEFKELNDLDPVVKKIRDACEELAKAAPSWRRQTLQTRFFETGDNYYLGMELTREYDRWKNQLGDSLVKPMEWKYESDETKMKSLLKFKGTLMHHIDRLWYDGVLEVIRTGDVYNPGARDRIPRLYLINSYSDTKLGELPVGESFRISKEQYEVVMKEGSYVFVRNVEGCTSMMPRSTTVTAKREGSFSDVELGEVPIGERFRQDGNLEEKYEIVLKKVFHVVVRNVEGSILMMPKSKMVKLEGNLTRGPDGNEESKVALDTFPVGHYVNFRSARLNASEMYLFAVLGDEQATPHFMRYSGLTGACINAMLFNNFVKQAIDGVAFIDRFKLYSAETNWSNGEVVQRGTGANSGEDGFLRPGFRYDHVLDYLHSKVIEYRETEQDLNNIVSRDWKVKLAASLIPRGMEFNDKFIGALNAHLHQKVFDKFVQEVNADNRLGGDALENALRARETALVDQRESIGYEAYWDEFLIGLNVDIKTKVTLEDPHAFVARRLDQICGQVIDFAKELYLYNERLSSELFNQPKPVDSILDDFAVEAQNFVNSLTQAAAFSSGALAFTLLGARAASIVGALLGALNIFISFGTMTNVSRYKIRNEEARVIFADEKMLGVLKGVFSVMDRAEQNSVRPDDNPFVITLMQQVDVFMRKAEYYDYKDTGAFLDAYKKLISNVNDPAEIQSFQKLLVTQFMVDDFHVNSYLQEDLVKIYKALEEMNQLLNPDVNRGRGSDEARNLFKRLTKFRGRMEGTLQRGPARFGFLKKRPLSQWDCTVVFKYFYSIVCCSTRSGALPSAPISAQTLSLIKQARHLSALHQSQILRREIRDLEGLYWASRESDIASLIFVAAFGVFIASIFFTIARIGGIGILRDVAFWATIPSVCGAILAAFHLWRKFSILLKLWGILGRRTRDAPSSDDRDNIRKVRGVTFTQILLTLARLVSAATAAVALPWTIAVNGFGDRLNTNIYIPSWLAFVAVFTAIGSTILFFIVEYRVRYNLSPKLGELVCESFRDEIEPMKRIFEVPVSHIDTKQVQERETWEYVAREFLHRYRFDTVFAADRFGSILQYLQSGMETRESPFVEV